MRGLDLTGEMFGRFVVLEVVGQDKRREYKWKCKCLCGKEFVALGGNIRSGNTLSCGCWKNEVARRRWFRHGTKATPTYNSWAGMRHRCTNPNYHSYAEYGGRGITVCKRWKDNFLNFLEDMGERPAGTTLDRINVNKGYSKTNCRWATAKEQALNRREHRRKLKNNRK